MLREVLTWLRLFTIRHAAKLLTLCVIHNNLSAVDFQLIGIQDNFCRAPFDFNINLDSAAVAEGTTELKVVERYSIIGRL